MKAIRGFSGEYRFLSNFWLCPVTYECITFKSSEHAYQACKSIDMEERARIARCASPKDAKRAGKTIIVRPNWEIIKPIVMQQIVYSKFYQNLDLRDKLSALSGYYLEETNWWGDTYWGVCNGVGQNQLGHILMKTRDYFINEHNFN